MLGFSNTCLVPWLVEEEWGEDDPLGDTLGELTRGGLTPETGGLPSRSPSSGLVSGDDEDIIESSTSSSLTIWPIMGRLVQDAAPSCPGVIGVGLPNMSTKYLTRSDVSLLSGDCLLSSS